MVCVSPSDSRGVDGAAAVSGEQPGGERAPRGAWSGGLTEALRLLRQARGWPPTEADAPPPSTFPMTPAAREAKRMAKQADRASEAGLAEADAPRAPISLTVVPDLLSPRRTP